MNTIPQTPSGKIDRKALPKPELKSEKGYVAPRTETEKRLVLLWSGVLGIEGEVISIDSNFFHLGGNSLNATILVAKVHKELKIKLALTEVFNAFTIRKMALIMSKKRETAFLDILVMEKKEYYELSYNQQRLWEFRKSNPDDIFYNMPARVTLNQKINEDAVKKVLNMLIERHESLRTSFIEVGGQPVQMISKTVVVPFQTQDISWMEESKRNQARGKIYSEVASTLLDLSKPPIFQFLLLKLGEDQYDLIFNIYHIISDGWSFEVLTKDFTILLENLYTGKNKELEPLVVQYKEFVAWQKQYIDDPMVKENAHRIWSDQLKEGFPPIQLPINVKGKSMPDDKSGVGYKTLIGDEILQELKELAGKYHTSLFIVLFSAFNLLLARISGQKEILCRVPTAGRNHQMLHPVAGYFISPIFVRTPVKKEDHVNFIDFMLRVHENTIEAINYQCYPNELVMDELKMKYPDHIEMISFNMVNLVENKSLTEITHFNSFHQQQEIGEEFLLYIYVIEHVNGIEFQWSYKKSLFKPETIEAFAAQYKEILEKINPRKT
jgi:acyl carrier protein